MNNSLLPTEETKDETTRLRERDSVLVRLIEAITDIQATSAWSTLKEEEFDDEMARLERLLKAESLKKTLDDPEIYRLQGRIETAKKFSLDKLLSDYRSERDTIRKKLL